jgi:hypothetical protein
MLVLNKLLIGKQNLELAMQVEVVLFRRTLFLSDFQTDIIQNGGW